MDETSHVAYDDFRVVRDNLSGRPRTTRDRLIPYCMFIDPELGRVGLGEVEAKRRGIALRVARLPMSSVLRARTTGETRGFMKAMLAGLPYTGLRDAILTHPTMAEGLNVLLAGVPAMTETTRAHAAVS
jgi:hypothetical protein